MQPSVSDVVASPGGVYAEKRPDIGFEPPEPHSGLSDQKRSSERGKAQRIPIEGQIERRFFRNGNVHSPTDRPRSEGQRIEPRGIELRPRPLGKAQKAGAAKYDYNSFHFNNLMRYIGVQVIVDGRIGRPRHIDAVTVQIRYRVP